jgi:hypothetical protein
MRIDISFSTTFRPRPVGVLDVFRTANELTKRLAWRGSSRDGRVRKTVTTSQGCACRLTDWYARAGLRRRSGDRLQDARAARAALRRPDVRDSGDVCGDGRVKARW